MLITKSSTTSNVIRMIPPRAINNNLDDMILRSHEQHGWLSHLPDYIWGKAIASWGRIRWNLLQSHIPEEFVSSSFVIQQSLSSIKALIWFFLLRCKVEEWKKLVFLSPKSLGESTSVCGADTIACNLTDGLNVPVLPILYKQERATETICRSRLCSSDTMSVHSCFSNSYHARQRGRAVVLESAGSSRTGVEHDHCAAIRQGESSVVAQRRARYLSPVHIRSGNYGRAYARSGISTNSLIVVAPSSSAVIGEAQRRAISCTTHDNYACRKHVLARVMLGLKYAAIAVPIEQVDVACPPLLIPETDIWLLNLEHRALEGSDRDNQQLGNSYALKSEGERGVASRTNAMMTHSLSPLWQRQGVPPSCYHLAPQRAIASLNTFCTRKSHQFGVLALGDEALQCKGQTSKTHDGNTWHRGYGGAACVPKPQLNPD
ncbi:Serine/threonine-protein phosphatase 7 long form-like protein [Senna tora]|uniref:Serine/threonine-protein phosphatase 7 long form-like protein n=1 Tax=Senna tora TaxID=362788 RepID=A0A834XAH6_9FABA|nr:Serine/threonine-protein phosphatase 7 long form-like protein [Senna tora]